MNIKHNQGFSAVALLITIIIIAVLGGGAYYYLGSNNVSNKDTVTNFSLQTKSQNDNSVAGNTTAEETGKFTCEKYVSVAEINNLFGYEEQTKLVSNSDSHICSWINQKTTRDGTFDETGHFHISFNTDSNFTEEICSKVNIQNAKNDIDPVNIGEVSCFSRTIETLYSYKTGTMVTIVYDDTLNIPGKTSIGMISLSDTKLFEKHMGELAKLIESRI